jgi:HSP20 family protein
MRLIQYTYPNLRRPVSGLSVRHPWAGLESEIDHLLSSALTGFAAASGGSPFPLHLDEDKDNAYVRAELPGVKREDIAVEIVDDRLTISASRKRPGAAESASLSRSVGVPDNISSDKIAASYENGVLTVTLPKSEAPKPRKIEVS